MSETTPAEALLNALIRRVLDHFEETDSDASRQQALLEALAVAKALALSLQVLTLSGNEALAWESSALARSLVSDARLSLLAALGGATKH